MNKRIRTLLICGVVVIATLSAIKHYWISEPFQAQASEPIGDPALQISTEQPPAVETISLPIQALPASPAGYELFQVKGARELAELKSRLGDQGMEILQKVNRIDSIRKGTTIVVPQSTTDLIGLSPFPQEIEILRSTSKLILVSRRVQAFAAYESGKLIRWGPTSTGKKSTPTPAGLYHTNWKSRETRSTINASWILPWCFNLDNFEGVSFHQYELPGFPASHGCVRLLEGDAKWIYQWAEAWMLSTADRRLLAYGTPVVIFGDYQYGKTPPWKRLPADPSATSISVAEAESALTRHMSIIEARAQSRQTILAALLRERIVHEGLEATQSKSQN